jgi:hypothetical protein
MIANQVHDAEYIRYFNGQRQSGSASQAFLQGVCLFDRHSFANLAVQPRLCKAGKKMFRNSAELIGTFLVSKDTS